MASSKKSRPSKAKPTDAKADDTPAEDSPPVDEDAKQTSGPLKTTTPAAEPGKDLPETDDAADETGKATDEADTTEEAPEDATAAEAGPPDDAAAGSTEGGDPDATGTQHESPPVSETVHPVPVPAVTETKPRNNTFLPLVLGGIIAGVIGYGAAEFDLLGPRAADPTLELRETISAQQERISALENAEPPQVDIPEVDLSGMENRLGDLETRIADLEARPVVVAPDGVDADQIEAYLAELSDLQRAVQSQRDEIEGLIANAKSVEAATASAARTANAQAALTRIQSSIDAGQPFEAEVDALREAGVTDVDPALDAVAAEGVPTLSELQSTFPEQARIALSTARAAGTDGEERGVASFLKRQLGVRSVTPQEGTDPDAVLSRAEASVQAGNLPAALTELETLPDEARAAIADWLDAAKARASAQQAADAVSQSLTAD